MKMAPITFECKYCGEEIEGEISEVYGVVRVIPCPCASLKKVKLICSACGRSLFFEAKGTRSVVVEYCGCVRDSISELLDTMGEMSDEIHDAKLSILKALKREKEKDARLIRED